MEVVLLRSMRMLVLLQLLLELVLLALLMMELLLLLLLLRMLLLLLLMFVVQIDQGIAPAVSIEVEGHSERSRKEGLEAKTGSIVRKGRTTPLFREVPFGEV
jgi:membrane protein YdbS with pleckstrin-like domain